MSDPQKIWQRQPTETTPMTLEDIRRKIHSLENRQRAAAIVWISIALALLFPFTRLFLKTPGLTSRLGLGVLMCWAVFGSWQAYRYLWPRGFLTDGNFRASLDFYRAQLEKKRDHNRHVWRRTRMNWCFVGLALFIGPGLISALGQPGTLSRAFPFFVLLGLWLALYFIMEKRTERQLQHEIDQLNQL